MPLSRLARGAVATVEPHCTVAEAARQMVLFSVGALVIADRDGAPPQGIVTDRDIVKRVAEGCDPAAETVERFIRPVETVAADAGVREILAKMRRQGVRRLPTVGTDGCLTGIVSLDDVLLRLGEEQGGEMGEVAAMLRKQFESEHPQPPAHDRAE